MPTYTLKIDFPDGNLGALFPGRQNIVIAKQVGGDGRALAAWIAFKPHEQSTVSWTEDYTVYATTSGEQGASPQVLEWQSGETLHWPVAEPREQSLEEIPVATHAAGLSFALQAEVAGKTVLIPLQGPALPAQADSGSLSWLPELGHFVLTIAE